jgi:regulator of protease activity HflC (stomatin/prohibitin superfamily)
MINLSEGEMQRRINEAEGKAQEILALAQATAESIEKLAAVISAPGGRNALRMQLGEQYLSKLNKLGKAGSRVVVPANLVDFQQWMSAIGLQEDNTNS